MENRTMTDDKDTLGIKEAYMTMYAAMIDKDEKTLGDVLEDGFVLVHMTGLRQSKREFIRAVMDGTLNYYSAGHESMDILSANCREAEMLGKTLVSAAVFGGGKSCWRLALRTSLLHTDKGWKIKKAIASTY